MKSKTIKNSEMEINGTCLLLSVDVLSCRCANKGKNWKVIRMITTGQVGTTSEIVLHIKVERVN